MAWTDRTRQALLGLAAVAFATTGFATAGLAASLEQMKEQGFARIAIANEPPWTEVKADGKVTGAAPEVARAVLQKLGVDEIVASISEYGAMIPGLQAGRFDMVTAGLFMRPQRCAAVIFSEPDLCDFEAFAVKTGNPTGIMTYADLGASDTVKVGAPGGGTEEKLALDSGVPRDRVIVVPDTQSGIKMLQDGRIDVYALPYLSLADAIEKSGGGLELVGPVENTPIFCAGAAFPKDATALRDAYNVVLAELKASGEFAKIIEPFGFKAEPAMMVTTEELCNRPTE
jgi:polar amino acid transport system substrate-binding protein